MSRPLTEQQALILFKESNVVIQSRVRSFPEGQTHIYIGKSDVRRALASDKPFDFVRGQLRVVKILKIGKRPNDGGRAHEHDFLRILGQRCQHPNVSQQPEPGPRTSCYWLTTPYLGPSLKAVMDEQRRHKAAYKEWLVLPEMFLWRLLRDIIAGLAYLHTGVLSDHGGRRGRDARPAAWRSIAHHTSATRITLDVTRRDENGYPRAVLTDFGEATTRPRDVTLGDWLDAKLDLEAVAVDFHMMAHGRKYSNSLDPSSLLWCDCFTSKHVPEDSFLRTWRECVEPSVKLRNFLDSFCNAGATHHGEPLTSDQILAQLNSRDQGVRTAGNGIGSAGVSVAAQTNHVHMSQTIFEEPILGHARLPIQIADLLYAADFTNQDIRDAIPELADATGYEEDPHESFEHQEADWVWPARDTDVDEEGDEAMTDAPETPTTGDPGGGSGAAIDWANICKNCGRS